ncbi:cell envelope integrity protein TolA [Serratia quinivorans]|uniref:cell envelope integrity protein TolA n=1 Tax=Serratia quinivorans TaxID=137545 RepID=UPI00217767BC|nr:cell envelope integrity protein TolA [Serratia quinivorans]CAI0894212.1 cell envelope integrity inner membrane protein TolA [Serratia quinivorans]
MNRVHSGFKKNLPALMLIVVSLWLTGCTKTNAVANTGPSAEGVDDLFAALDGKATPAAGDEVSNYAGQVRAAIQSHFYDANAYAGKTCALRMKFAPDGMLLAVRSESGDPALCRAAITAITNTRFPKPPSQAVYGAFKNPVLEFRPQ